MSEVFATVASALLPKRVCLASHKDTSKSPAIYRWVVSLSKMSPAGTKEQAALPSLTGLERLTGPTPSDESLGYSRESSRTRNRYSDAGRVGPDVDSTDPGASSGWWLLWSLSGRIWHLQPAHPCDACNPRSAQIKPGQSQSGRIMPTGVRANPGGTVRPAKAAQGWPRQLKAGQARSRRIKGVHGDAG